MKSFLTRQLKQVIVHWANSTPNGSGGESFDAPVQITGRWEDKQELFTNADGQELLSQAIVYLSQDVNVGEYLYLGTLTVGGGGGYGIGVGGGMGIGGGLLGIGITSVPEDISNSMRIMAYEKIPSMNSRSYLRKVWVK